MNGSMNGTLPSGTLPKDNGVKSPGQPGLYGPYSRLMDSAAKQSPARRTSCLIATALLLLVFFSHAGIRYHSVESLRCLFGTGSNSSNHGSSTDFNVSNSNGLCRVEYSIATFDGGYARVCNPQLCVGREKLKVLEAASGTRRWSPFDESQYMKLYRNNNISGWVNVSPLAYQKLLLT